MSWSTEPVVITCAPTGAEVTREDNPNLPVTRDEIADAMVDARAAGAAVVHIHAREPDGSPTMDRAVVGRIAELVRERTDLVVNVSTGGEVGMTFEERAGVLDVEPEIGTLNLGTMNFGEGVFENPPEFVRKLAETMRERGIRPELEVYDVGMLATAGRLLREGLLAEQARRIGLVEEVAGNAVTRALELAGRVAEAEPFALAQTKRLLALGEESSFDATLNHEVDALLACVDEGQAREGLRAFVDKREPVFDQREVS